MTIEDHGGLFVRHLQTLCLAISLGAGMALSAPAIAGSPAKPAADIPWPKIAAVPHPGRNGALTERELAMATAAWQYFVKATQKETGLANSVLSYPSTTMWDTASYMSALVAAETLGIIDRQEFDQRMLKLLGTLADLDLFRHELPNKVYDTRDARKVDYANKPGEIGYSAIDIGRLLIWLAIVKERYPYLANTVDRIPLGWSFCRVVGPDGNLQGAGLKPDGSVVYYQEGRLGYEQYAAKGFGIWGFHTGESSKPAPYATIDIYGVPVPYDARDPRVFKTQNYVVSESYILDGIELNFDLPDDHTSGAMVFSDGWAAEFAQRVYHAQQRRYEETGVLTARSEHQVEGDPFFVYDTVFADGYAWNTLSPNDEYKPDRAAIAAKAAIGLWALWKTPYTDKLFEAVSGLQTDSGFYEGLYETGSGVIPLQTANNNGIILAALLYKAQGPIFRHLDLGKQLWFTQGALDGANSQQRNSRCLPAGPLWYPPLPNPYWPLPPVAKDEFLYCTTLSPKSWDKARPATHVDLAAHNCSPDQPRLVCPVRRPGK